jgi:hypothetical protein
MTKHLLKDTWLIIIHCEHNTFCDFTLSWNTSYVTENLPKELAKTSNTLGGNFVDVSLKVLVLNSAGTVLVSGPGCPGLSQPCCDR